ncbi:hypothetical protein NLX83_08185 [Allokutzneria sp. A3M-2-11 16]|uniref:hypothetical protein n=1 Tax=Allokutzneria sp. A3M-2-11 16 TaxID=2962043 RepID=UPI0020B8FBB9|nr:hypothetical protein [Allokutzneria sp. A3M-2-11 16]MCP3799233.1 hypothetical protein [Allokutzneria sp. A3M-2-11 16]
MTTAPSPSTGSLWDVSSALALHEAAEAGDWVRTRVLSPGAVSWYLRALERQLGPDRGLGDSRLRQELTALLRSGLEPDSRDRRRLVQLMPLITNGYLGRWASAVDSARTPSPERLARAVATHLLDCGHSSGYLHRWVRALSKDRRSYSRSFTKRLEPVGKVWIAGHATPLPLLPPEHGVDILSPKSEEAMYSGKGSDRLDEALELVAQLNTGTAAAAVAGVRAAIESLLFHPDDESDVKAADRLAVIVTCSLPHAELTTLSYKYKTSPPELTAEAPRAPVGGRAAHHPKHLPQAPPAARHRHARGQHDRHRARLGAARGRTAPRSRARPRRARQVDQECGPLDLAARAENSLALVGDPVGPAVTNLLE